MRRPVKAILAALGCLWFLVQVPFVLAAPGPECLRGFIVEIRKTVGNQKEAEELFARVFDFSDDGARGATVAVQYVGGERFVTLFDNLDNLDSLGRNPFTKDDEVFEVIARLSDFQKPGTTAAVGHLAASQNDAQGALFQLFVTKKVAGNGTNYGLITGLETNFVGVGGATRRVDLVEAGGIHHEVKSWTDVVANANDGRLAGYAVEFQSDIVLHAGDNFTNYKVHFPELINTPAQKDLIRDKLLQQFDDDGVKAAFAGNPAALAAAKLDFETAWNANQIAVFHSFP